MTTSTQQAIASVAMAVYEVADVLILNPALIPNRPLLTRPILNIEDELKQPDRQALDNVIFDALGLTPGEREAVYEAVFALVNQRLEKAKSLR